MAVTPASGSIQTPTVVFVSSQTRSPTVYTEGVSHPSEGVREAFRVPGFVYPFTLVSK